MSDNLNSGSLLSSLSNGSRPARSTTPMTNTRSTSSSALPGGLSSAQRQAINRELINAQTKQTNLLNSSATINTMLNQNQNANSQFNTSIMRQIGAIDAASNKITSAIATQTNQLISSINNMSNAITESINSLKEGINHLFYERAKAYSDKVMDEETQKDYDRYAKDFVKTFFSEKFWGMIASVELVSLSKLKEQSIKYLMQNKQIANMLGIMPYGDKRFENSKMVPFTKEIADAIKEVPKYLKDIANSVDNITDNQERTIKFFSNEYLERSDRLININEEMLDVMGRLTNVVIGFKNTYTHVNDEAIREYREEVRDRRHRFYVYRQGLAQQGLQDTQQNRATVVQQLIQNRTIADQIERAFAEREAQESTVREQTNRQTALTAEDTRLVALIAQLQNNPQNNPQHPNFQNIQNQINRAQQDRADVQAQLTNVQNEINLLTQVTAGRISPLNIPAGVTREQNLRERDALERQIRDLRRRPEDLNLRSLTQEVADTRRDLRYEHIIRTGSYEGRVRSSEQNRNRVVRELVEGLNKNTYALRHNTEEVKKSITALDLAKTTLKAAINPMNIWKIISTGSRWVLKFMAPYMLYTMLFKMGANTLMGKNWGGELLHGLISAPFKLLGGIGTGDGKTVGAHAFSWWTSIKETLGGFYNNHIKGILESIGNKLGEFKDMFKSWIGDVWWDRITSVIEGVKKYTKLVWDAYLNPDESNAKVARKELFRPIYEFMLDIVHDYIVPAAMWGAVGYTGVKNLAHPIKFIKELWRPVKSGFNFLTGGPNRWYARYSYADQALDRNAARILGNNVPQGARDFRVNTDPQGNITGITYRVGDGIGRFFRGRQTYNPVAALQAPPPPPGLTQQQANAWQQQWLQEHGDIERENLANTYAQIQQESRRDFSEHWGTNANDTEISFRGANFSVQGGGFGNWVRRIFARVGRFSATAARWLNTGFSAIGAFGTALGKTVTWIWNIGSTLMTIGKLYDKFKDKFSLFKSESTRENGEVDNESYIGKIFNFFKTGFIDPMLKNIKEGFDIVYEALPEVGSRVITSIWEWVKKEGPSMLAKSWELLKKLGNYMLDGLQNLGSWLLDKLAGIFGKDKGERFADSMVTNSAKAITQEKFDKYKESYSTSTKQLGEKLDIATKEFDSKFNLNAEQKNLLSYILSDEEISASKEATETNVKKRLADLPALRKFFREDIEKDPFALDKIASAKNIKFIYDSILNNPQIVSDYLKLRENTEAYWRTSQTSAGLTKESMAKAEIIDKFEKDIGGNDLFGLNTLLTDPDNALLRLRKFDEAFKDNSALNNSQLAWFLRSAMTRYNYAKPNKKKLEAQKILADYNKSRDRMLFSVFSKYGYSVDMDNIPKGHKLMDAFIDLQKSFEASYAKVESDMSRKFETNVKDLIESNTHLAEANKKAAEREEAIAAVNGGLSLGIVAQWTQSGKFKTMMENAFGWIGDKIGAVVNFFKKQDYGKLFSDAMSGLGSMTGGILSALFGADKADNFSRAAYAYADKHNLRFAKSFFGGARKSILMSVEDLVSHAAKTGQNVEEIRDLLRSQGVKDNEMPSGGGGEVVTPFTGNRGLMTTAGSITEGINADMFKDSKTGIAKGNIYDSDTSLKISLASTLFPNEGYRTNEHEKIYPNAKYDRSSYNQDFHSRMGLYAIDLPKVAALVANTYGNTKIIDRILSDKDLKNLVTVKSDGKRTTYEARSGGDIMNMSNKTYRNSIISKLNDLAHMTRDHKGIIDENTWKEMIFQYIKSTRWKEFGFDGFKYIPAIYSEILDTAWWMGNGAARSVVAKAISRTIGTPLEELKGKSIKEMMGHKNYRPLLEGKQFKFLQNIFNAALGRADAQWKRDRITRNMRVLGVPSTSGDFAVDITDKSNYSGSSITSILDYGNGITSKNFSGKLNEMLSTNAYGRLNTSFSKILSTDGSNNEQKRILNVFKNEQKLMSKVAEIEKKDPSEWSKDEAVIMAKFAGLLDKYNALATKEGANNTSFYNTMTQHTTNITNLLERAVFANKGVKREDINAARKHMIEGSK